MTEWHECLSMYTCMLQVNNFDSPRLILGFLSPGPKGQRKLRIDLVKNFLT